MYADILFQRELDLFSSESRGTRDFSAAFSGFPSRALGFFDPYFIILLRGGGKGIRLQILLRLSIANSRRKFVLLESSATSTTLVFHVFLIL